MSPSVVSRKAVHNARRLRNRQTEGEKKLWRVLRSWKQQFGLHVRRQVPIGPYVADFAIHSIRLVIEVDGEHHFTAEGIRKDEIREQFLSDAGYRTIRVNTGDLEEAFDGSIEKIMHAAGLMK